MHSHIYKQTPRRQGTNSSREPHDQGLALAPRRGWRGRRVWRGWLRRRKRRLRRRLRGQHRQRWQHVRQRYDTQRVQPPRAQVRQLRTGLAAVSFAPAKAVVDDFKLIVDTAPRRSCECCNTHVLRLGWEPAVCLVALLRTAKQAGSTSRALTSPGELHVQDCVEC